METNVRHLLLRKTVVPQTSIFSERKLKEMYDFEEQKVTRYILGKVYIGIIVSSCLSSTKPYLRFLLNCFFREMKGFYRVPLEMRLISGT